MNTFSDDATQRIAVATRYVEQLPRNFNPNNAPPPRRLLTMACFTVTTQIAAATSQLAPGFGYGTMLDFNATTGLFMAGTTTGIKIWSLLEYPIKVGANVQTVVGYGQYWYDVTMCANAVTS